MCSRLVILQLKPRQLISVDMLVAVVNISCSQSLSQWLQGISSSITHVLMFTLANLLVLHWAMSTPVEAAPLWQSCHHYGIDSGLHVAVLSGDSCLTAFPHLCVFSIIHSSFFSNGLCSFITCAPLHSNSLQASEDMVKTLHLLMLPRWSVCTFKSENTCCQWLIEFLMRSFHHLYL